MKDMLVLGIGNPLLGDDGFGVEVVRRLREQKGRLALSFSTGERRAFTCSPISKDGLTFWSWTPSILAADRDRSSGSALRKSRPIAG